MRPFPKAIKGIAFTSLGLISLIFPALVILHIYRYGSEIPLYDAQEFSSVLALKAVQGRLSPMDFFLPVHSIHRMVFTHLVTVLLAYTTQWDVGLELYTIVLVVAANHLLLLYLIWKLDRMWVLAAIIPISALLWSLQQETNWILSTHNSLYWPSLFLLAGVVVLLGEGRQARNVLWAIFFSVCATFSNGNGLVAWPLLFGASLLLGYRKRWMAAVWIASGIIAVGAYLLLPGLDLTAANTVTTHTPLISRMGLLPQALLIYLGCPMSVEGATLWIGLAGSVLFILNGWLLWDRQGGHEQVAVWGAVGGYSILTGLMTIGGRGVVVCSWYIGPATFFWIALIGAVIGTLAAYQPTRITRILLAGSLAFIVVLVGLYVRDATSSYRLLFMQYPAALERMETCFRQFPLTQTPCYRDSQVTRFHPEIVNEIAAERLTIYNDQFQSMEWPTSYQPDHFVIVDTGDLYWNVHVHQMLLNTVDDTVELHIIPAAQTESADRYLPNQGITAELTGSAIAPIREDALRADGMWYIAPTDHSGLPDLAAAFGATIIPFYQAAIPETDLTLTGYLVNPTVPDAPFINFGAHFALYQWRLYQPVDVQPCQRIDMESVWSITTPPDTAYTMTLVLVDPNTGSGIVQIDKPPSPVPVADWQANQLYGDYRSLTIPCDLAAGTYPLLIAFYSNQSTNLGLLLAEHPDGTPIGEYLFLTSLNVK